MPPDPVGADALPSVPNDPPSVLNDPARLAALDATGLCAVPDAGVARFTRLVTRLLDVPVSLVSLVDDARQSFPGATGLAEPWATVRGTPLSHSFCKHVVVSGAPLVVSDAARHPVVRANPAITELGVKAYAGMPLVDGDGHTLGSLCAIDHVPRTWTDDDLEVLRDLAAACSSELQLRSAAARADVARAEAELARADAEQARRRAEALQADTADARRRAERAGARLELLGAATQAMTSTLDADAALRRLARVVVPALADWCAVHVFDDTGMRRVALEHSRGVAVPTAPAGASAGPEDPLAAIRRGTHRTVELDAATLRSAGAGASAAATEHLVLASALGGDSALVSALLDRSDEPLGALTLARDADRPWTAADRMVVGELVHRAGTAVASARRYQAQRNAAETLQSSLLTELVQPTGLELAARYRPAMAGVDVGGDWYDAFPVGEGATAVVIGDVMGHDLVAAGQMGQLRNMLRTLAHDRSAPPSEVLSRLDRVADGLGVRAFATCVLAMVAPSGRPDGTWRLRWSNAGHLPPVVLRADGGSEVAGSDDDLMLGIEPGAVRHDRELVLARGDTALLVTDGLVETRSGSLDEGLAQLRLHARRATGGSLEQLCDELIASAGAAGNADDIAVLAVRVPR
jgi:GAF domain-containing protein